jgi:hypothetical protein
VRIEPTPFRHCSRAKKEGDSVGVAESLLKGLVPVLSGDGQSTQALNSTKRPEESGQVVVWHFSAIRHAFDRASMRHASRPFHRAHETVRAIERNRGAGSWQLVEAEPALGRPDPVV